jgi:AraC family transcriptional regulator, transcriptional activator FtrA
VNTKLNQNPDWPKLAKQANWSVEKLAKECNVSARTLERHFLKAMSKTPRQWLAEQRQKQALELLRDGSSVKETAAKLGYKYAGNLARRLRASWPPS